MFITNTLAFQSIPQSLGLLARAAAPSVAADEESFQAAADSPEGGYVYLSVSPSMPDFVQIAASAKDPRGREWTLETFSGVTRFRSACVCRTSDCRSLIAQFRRSLSSDQIPHHPELFKISLRFARQILEDEAKAFPGPVEKPAPRQKRKAWMIAGLVAAIAAIPLFFLPVHHQPAPKLALAYRHSLPQIRE